MNSSVTMSVLVLFAVQTAALSSPAADGLMIHLKADALTGLADGDAVTVWPDAAVDDAVDGSLSMVEGYSAPTYKTGVLNGYPVMRFTRSEMNLLSSANWSFPDVEQGVTIIAVFTGGSSGGVERIAQVGAVSGASSKMIGADVSAAGAQRSGGRFNNGYALTPSGRNPLTAGVFHIGLWQMAPNDRHDSLWYAVDDLTSEILQSNNPANVITFDSTGNALTVGNGKLGGGEWATDFYNGDLAELLVYNAQLTQSQKAQTCRYLSDKYGLPFSLADILVSQSDGITAVKEGGATDTITFRLTADPGAYPVTLRLTDVLDPDQVTLTPSEAVFTSGNWQTPLDVTVTAVDDASMERAQHDATLWVEVLTDPASVYAGVILNPIAVQIEDNDCGAWGFSRADYNLDCKVNLADFSIFVEEWVACGMPDPMCQGFRF